MRMHNTPSLLAPLALVLGVALAACAPTDVRKALENQKPTVSLADQKLTALDFEHVDLLFGLKVDNPNPIGLTLGGLDYDLKLAGQSFVTGNQDKQMKLAASGASRIDLPVSLAFADIYKGLKDLQGQSEVPYELTTGLLIDVPLLGKLRYPVTTKGVLPLPKLPKVSLKGISVDKLSLTSATLALKLQVDNPNGFNLGLDRLRYDLTVNGKRWASADKSALGDVKEQQTNTLTLPLTLHLMELGSGVYNLLGSSQPLDYSLSGTLDASSANQLIGKFGMPFTSNGRVSLSR